MSCRNENRYHMRILRCENEELECRLVNSDLTGVSCYCNYKNTSKKYSGNAEEDWQKLYDQFLKQEK